MTRPVLRSAPAVAFLLFVAAAPGAARGEKLRVEVEGLGGALSGLLENRSLRGSDVRQNVLSALTIAAAAKKEEDLTERRIRTLHARAPEEIRRALEPFGYYRPTIDATLKKEPEGRWLATYRLDPGMAIRVESVDLKVTGEGASDWGFRVAQRRFPLREGDPLAHAAYQTGKAAFEEMASRIGYLDGRFETSELRVDLERYRSSIVLHYETGPRYLFGPVTFRQEALDPDLLRGYVTWERGAPLNTDKLLELQNALSDSPYFSRVEVVAEQEQAEGQEVPIAVNLVPAKPQRYQFGLGYGTDTGPRGSALAEYRRLNRRGHRAEMELKLSQIEKSGTAKYLLPGPYPRTDMVTFSLGYADIRTDTSESKAFLAGADRSQLRGLWRESLSLLYEREDFKVGVDRGVARLLVPGVSYSRVIAENRITTRKGYRLQLKLSGAQEGALSNATFLQAYASGKGIRPLGRRGRLITRAETGYTETPDFRKLPPRIRFFAGGDQSVRGYGFQELGERDEEGNVIGGPTLLVGSVEYEYRFLPKWGLATFFDAGAASDSFSGPFQKGVGLGVRWISPVGPIRLDGAYALDDPRGFRIHVNIGPDL
jgi:translocation and assembly module TamA